VSGHKYLASPTAGLVLGTRAFVNAFRAQERGIGRAMKPSKEAILGVLAALEERSHMDVRDWQAKQCAKVGLLIDVLRHRQELDVRLENDPAGMPFQRVRLAFRGGVATARDVVGILASGRPSIRVMEHSLETAVVHLELVALEESEVRHIAVQLVAVLDAHGAR
jgi:seryl-tRNA(Sec) selenium transferase